MKHAQGNPQELFRMIVEEQDKYDAFTPKESCDRCIQAPAARLFFEPNETGTLRSLILCTSHLKDNRDALADQNITGGYIEVKNIWWWNDYMGVEDPLVNA